ncbi:RNA polymerase factor sigma-54 [Clostridium hydrogenum]|uniref:RNA polymerase factor sigma-54 n=1 Tax=Clostridium hydrogenum TaxID=2855764 RepID=UPI001F0B7A45|nr:RNA polymerase factor sigma-54 [Clostridium hydrogenum]
MNLDFNLNLSQQQKLVMTQQMQMSVKLLQMSSLELNEYVEKEIEENPLLETEYTDKTDNKETNEEIDYKELVKYLEFDNYGHESTYRKENEEVSPFNFISNEESLQEYLLKQIGEVNLDIKTRKICEYIIENLDEKGYLPDDILQIASELKINEEIAEEALEIVQSLDPDGVGARNLGECLKIQLEKKNIYDDNLFLIIDKHLNNIAENKYNVIAKELGISPKKAQEYGDIIKKLEPKPSRGFYTGDETKFIVPDAAIKKIDDEFFIVMNESSTPKLSINTTYKDIINDKKSENAETQEYVKSKLNSAMFLLKSIEQRKSTLYSVLKEIVDYQSEYFHNGSKYLRPMTLKDIADKINMHESTVSRAIREKYVYTDNGIVKIKDLFTTAIQNVKISEGDLSSIAVKESIKELIDNENKVSPLSDQKISEILNSKGMNISRRTVAKYREEMNIKASSKRKRF